MHHHRHRHYRDDRLAEGFIIGSIAANANRGGYYPSGEAIGGFGLLVFFLLLAFPPVGLAVLLGGIVIGVIWAILSAIGSAIGYVLGRAISPVPLQWRPVALLGGVFVIAGIAAIFSLDAGEVIAGIAAFFGFFGGLAWAAERAGKYLHARYPKWLLAIIGIVAWFAFMATFFGAVYLFADPPHAVPPRVAPTHQQVRT
jgi:hypothetical protein